MFKFFDQLCRPLLYQLAEVAGIPKQILSAYSRFQESLTVHNSLALGLGAPHRRDNGIPQGCPLSMMMIALLMRPWMLLMLQHNVTPRTLADDLLATTSGPGHVERLISATEDTHLYLQRMGARVATSKSILFSSFDHGERQAREARLGLL